VYQLGLAVRPSLAGWLAEASGSFPIALLVMITGILGLYPVLHGFLERMGRGS
jgi:hypothetical protein